MPIGTNQLNFGTISDSYHISYDEAYETSPSLTAQFKTVGGGGDDYLFGGSDSENFIGYDGNDKIIAGGGNDWIDGGGGNDTIKAGAGNDTIVVNEAGYYESIDGGDGVDNLRINHDWQQLVFYVSNSDGTVQYLNADNASFEGLYSSLSQSISQVDYGSLVAKNVEKVDILSGSAYNDLIVYQQGSEYHGGGGGIDTFYANWSGWFNDISWTNTGAARYLTSGVGEAVTVSGMERLLLKTGIGDDYIDNTAFYTNDDFRTGSGDDTIKASQGDDYVDAGEGNDTIDYLVDSHLLVSRLFLL